jgi:hypothetical protein
MLGDLQIPDAIEPAVGWRGWYAVGGTLMSPTRYTPWNKGHLSWDGICRCREGELMTMHDELAMETSEAARLAREAVENMLLDCNCGINAFRDREQLAESGYPHWCHVVGEVELHGQVRVYEKGYRAEHARASRIWATKLRHVPRARRAAKEAGIEYAGRLRFPGERARVVDRLLALAAFALACLPMLTWEWGTWPNLVAVWLLAAPVGLAAVKVLNDAPVRSFSSQLAVTALFTWVVLFIPSVWRVFL